MNLDDAIDALKSLAGQVPPAPGRVVLERAGEVATLRLESAGTRNALTVQMMVALAQAVRRVQSWDVRALLVCGEGPAFCAGGHLGQVHAALATPQRGLTMARAMAAVVDAVLDAPPVTVAVVHGPAIGGGAELAMGCDFRVGGPGTVLHFVQGRLGVATGWGGAGRLTRLLGRQRALRVLLEARRLDVDESLRLGLIDAVYTDPAQGALQFLATLVPHASAVVALKAQVVASQRADGGQQRAAEAFATVWGGPTHRRLLDGRGVSDP